MVRTEGLFPNLQGVLIQRLGLGVLALILVELRQVVESGRHMRMIGAHRLFQDP
jgi:hypothetical protein